MTRAMRCYIHSSRQASTPARSSVEPQAALHGPRMTHPRECLVTPCRTSLMEVSWPNCWNTTVTSGSLQSRGRPLTNRFGWAPIVVTAPSSGACAEWNPWGASWPPGAQVVWDPEETSSLKELVLIAALHPVSAASGQACSLLR